MLLFLLRRLAAMLATMVAVSVVVFVALEFSPGSVATKVLGQYSTEAQRQLWLAENGYLDPAPIRYGRWVRGVLDGDFGPSLRYKVPVGEVLWPRLANTAILGAATFAVMVPLALVMGVLAGMREGATLDRVITVFSVGTTSVPEFASAVFLSAVFVFWLQVLPGTSGMADGFRWQELVLPVAVLVLYDTGYVARVTRAAMVEVMRTPYIRTAVLKGLSRSRVLLRHALRNALIAPLTVITLQVNWLLSGVIVVESFFAYKGFGALLLEAALYQDLYMIQACALVAAAVAVASQTVADIGYGLLDPKIRLP